MTAAQELTPEQIADQLDKLKRPPIRPNAASLTPKDVRADVIKKRRKAERKNKTKARRARRQ